MNVFKQDPLTQDQIALWLRALRPHAHAPLSCFHVACVLRSGDFYFGGVNVEMADHRLTTHGEEGAISALIAALGGGAKIDEGWILGADRDARDGNYCAPPCGKCRQQIISLAGPEARIHSFSLSGAMETFRVKDFLPGVFSPGGIADKVSAASSSPRALTRKGPLAPPEIKTWLESLESAAFVSGVTQSAVLRLGNGFYVAGTKVEEVAFISINPAQAAAAVAVSAFGRQEIEEVWFYTKAPPDTYASMPLSALQTLHEFAAHDKIPLHFLGGAEVTLDLQQAAKVAPTTDKPFQKL
jgi:cytidine deaminase